MGLLIIFHSKTCQAVISHEKIQFSKMVSQYSIPQETTDELLVLMMSLTGMYLYLGNGIPVFIFLKLRKRAAVSNKQYLPQKSNQPNQQH